MVVGPPVSDSSVWPLRLRFPRLEHPPVLASLLEPSGFRFACLSFNSDFLSLLLHARHCARISFSTASFSNDVFSLS